MCGVLRVLLRARHDATFLVFANAFLEKVRFPRKGNKFHEIERVFRFVYLEKKNE